MTVEITQRGKLIGLHSPAGGGKDTVARHIQTYYPARFRSVAFADPIRAALKAIFGWDDSFFERPKKEEVIEWLGKSPRQIMQTLGTEWGRELVYSDLWLALAGIAAEPYLGAGFNVFIRDVRFQNEADLIHEAGGEVWFIERDAVAPVTEHKSESGIKFVEGVDKRINNNETLGYLFNTVETLAQGVMIAQDRAAVEASQFHENLEAQREAYDRSMLEHFHEDGTARVEPETVDTAEEAVAQSDA